MHEDDDNQKNQFEMMEFDASIHPCCWILSCPLVHCGFCPIQTTLRFNTEEVTRIDKALCGSKVAVRPYGELGTVEKNTCCCFVCFDSDLGTVVTGWGCDHRKADLFCRIMKERITDRGDAAQSILSDQIMERSISVNGKLDRLVAHIGVNPLKYEIKDRGSD